MFSPRFLLGKRKLSDFDDSIDGYLEQSKRRTRKRFKETNDILAVCSVMSVNNQGCKERKTRSPDEFRDQSWWENGFQTWSVAQFKKKIRVNRVTFTFLVQRLRPVLEKSPTNAKPNPTSVERQVASTLYRYAHGVSSKELACTIFNKTSRAIVYHLYDEFVKLPATEDEWQEEMKGFLENYGFPCSAAWDGFHIYVSTRIKQYYSFKKRYTVTNMGLVSYNKRFLYAAVGAPGSTHDARILKNCSLYKKIIDGDIIPDKVVELDNYGAVPFVTIGDSAFPKHSWLIKAYDENTLITKEKYFNKYLYKARVVTENAYGMMKGRWRFSHKKTECRISNIRYIILAIIALHNICIDFNDPCKPRWVLKVKRLNVRHKVLGREQNKDASELNRLKISNWLWSQEFYTAVI